MSEWPHDLKAPIPMEHPDSMNMEIQREHLQRAIAAEVSRYTSWPSGARVVEIIVHESGSAEKLIERVYALRALDGKLLMLVRAWDDPGTHRWAEQMLEEGGH